MTAGRRKGNARAPFPPDSEPLYPEAAPFDAKRSVHQLIETLRRGWWLVLLITGACIGVAWLYVQTLPPPSYQAQTLLLLVKERSYAEEGALSGVIEGTAGARRDLSNQLLVLQQSFQIAEETAKRILELQAEGAGPFTFVTPATPTARDLALRLQAAHITARPSEYDADAVWVIASAARPDEAILLANTYTEEFVERTRRMGRQQIASSRAFLKTQIASRYAELQQHEERIRQLGSNGALALDSETHRSISQIAQIEAALDDARVQLAVEQATMTSLDAELNEMYPRLARRAASGTEKEITLAVEELTRMQDFVARIAAAPLPAGATAGAEQGRQNEIRKYEQDIARQQQRLQQLAEQNASEIIASGGLDPSGSGKTRVAQLNQQLIDTRIRISGIQAQIRALEQRLGSYNRRLETVPAQSMQLAQAERARSSTEQIYLRLVEKLEEASIAEEAEVGFAQLLRPAIVAMGPSDNGRGRYLVLSAILGLLLGGLAAVLKRKLDTRLFAPSDLNENGLHVLAEVPDMRSVLRREFGKARQVPHLDRMVSPTLLTLLRPLSPASEAYRRLYLNLQFSRPDVVVQTLLVASAEQSVGKTTTALNLALTAARTGRRTLLVDTDLHRPSHHVHLGFASSYSLADLLSDPIAATDAAPFSTGIPNLYAITTASPPLLPADLYSSVAMRGLIRSWRRIYDVIVFDTPPVLLTADAALLATQCDTTLLVARSGKTDLRALEHVLTELEKVGAHVAGIVLNQFDPGKMVGYGSTYRYRYQRFGYGEEAS